MLFTCGKMKRKYGVFILLLVQLSFSIVLVARNTCAYPYGLNAKERNTGKSSETNNTEIDNAQSDLDELIAKTFENVDPSVLERKSQRDTSRYQDEDRSRVLVNSSGRTSVHRRTVGKERAQLDTRFVFPGEIGQVPTCKGSTYCEKIDTYPEDIVNQAIQRNESLKYLAGVDVVSDIVQRIDVTDDVPLCVSTEQVIFPQSAENKDNEWKYIANQDNFKQGIRIEKCSKESNSCSVIGGLAEGYKTSCRQKYVYRQLASVQTDGKIVPDTFRFPSSCCCHVSFNGNPLTRMGISIEERSQITPVKTRKRKRNV